MMYALLIIPYLMVGFATVAIYYRFGDLTRRDAGIGFWTVVAWPVEIILFITIAIINLVAYANDRIFDLIDGKGY